MGASRRLATDRLPVAGESFPELAELLCQFGVFQPVKSFARDYHYIPTRQLILVQSKGLANQTFQSIASNRKPDAFFADYQSQARVLEFIGACKEQDVLARNLGGRGVEDGFELSGSQQTLFPTEVSTHHPFRLSQTVRRLRPLARRRDKTWRPFLVAIRARKPWVRARLRVLGWKVRFMMLYLVVTNGPEVAPEFEETGDFRES